MTAAPTTPLYTSRLSLPYTPHTPLNTLDLHRPTTPPLSPSYTLIYIHGGAFRDPLVLSPSLIPSLPALFSKNHHLRLVASLNYRLSPHPHHPTKPSSPDDKEKEASGRNARWSLHIDDVRDAICWLKKEGGMGGGEWIVVGHSVGGTMGMMLGLEAADGRDERGGQEEEGRELGKWGREIDMSGLKAVISIEGIYDFVALRDAHLSMRALYDGFTDAAFGSEEEGCWERGDVLRSGRKVRGKVEVVLVVHSREDELVEWEQAERMVEVLKREGRDGVGVLVEVEGKHQAVITEGVVLGRVVERAVGMLVERNKGD